jgi:hypothetical protein
MMNGFKNNQEYLCGNYDKALPTMSITWKLQIRFIGCPHYLRKTLQVLPVYIHRNFP